MAKQLAAVHNHTDKTFTLSRVASGGRALIVVGAAPGQILGRGNYPMDFEIPDNSDCEKYFETNHIYLVLTDPVTKETRSFSFWDDDTNNFQINFCEDKNWKAGFKMMRGGDHGKNFDNVVLKISETKPGEIELTAVTLTGLEEKKSIARAFLNFAKSTKISPSDKTNQAKILTYMQHPDFKAITEKAAEAGYQTVGITFGETVSIIVGREYQTGIVIGVGAGGPPYAMVSTAFTLGAQEGLGYGIGLIMSKEPVSQMTGYSFIAELALGIGVGIGGAAFVTFSGYFGFQILYIAGVEEVEVSVGIDHTVVAKLH